MRPLLVSVLSAFAAALPGQDLVDLPWRETGERLLQVQVAAPGEAAAWRTAFPGVFAPWSVGDEPVLLEGAAVMPPLYALPLLLHGPGGAAALHEAARRVEKLAIELPTDEPSRRRMPPDDLRDALCVRLLEQAGTDAAALVGYALDKERDAFVRAAAADAVARGELAARVPGAARAMTMRVDRPVQAGMHAGLARLPRDFDLVVGLRAAALPSIGPMFECWRRLQRLLLQSCDGEVTHEERIDAQLRMDQPGQLPFELAARFGNWRVDHALFAARGGAAATCWLHLAGAFQPQRVADGLRAAGVAGVSFERGEVRATLDGWSLRCSPLELEAWQGRLDGVARGGRATKRLAAFDAAPIWAFVPAHSALGEPAGLDGAALEVRFDLAEKTLRATAETTGDAGSAKQLLTRWSAWQRARSLEPDWQNPNIAATSWREVAASPDGELEHEKLALSWLRCVAAVEARVDGARVEWRLDLSGTSTMDLVRILRCDPMHLLEEVRR